MAKTTFETLTAFEKPVYNAAFEQLLKDQKWKRLGSWGFKMKKKQAKELMNNEENKGRFRSKDLKPGIQYDVIIASSTFKLQLTPKGNKLVAWIWA